MGREEVIVKTEIEIMDVNSSELNEGVRHHEETSATLNSIPNQRSESSPSTHPIATVVSTSKKRLRTSVVLEEMDKKFLLEQYVSERQKNVNLQLQNRVSQLEREVREKERKAQDTEKVHVETLALAESVHRGNVLNEIGRLMDSEFNCSICNEVFIEPAVLNCGHTFCSYCINRALLSDYLCPVCRTGYNFNPPSKNIEMRNFINKIFGMLPDELKNIRDQIVQERAALPAPDARENNINRARRTARRRPRSISPINFLDFLHTGERLSYRVPRTARSRSRSISISLSDTETDGDSSAISSLEIQPGQNQARSPTPPTSHRRVGLGSRRERRSSRSPTSEFLSNPGGSIPLPWTTNYSSRRDQPETRRPVQSARRGRPFIPGRHNYLGSRWGPRRQSVRESENHASSPSSGARNRLHDSNSLMRRRSAFIGSLRLGQRSRAETNPRPPIEANEAPESSTAGNSFSRRVRLPVPRYARRTGPLNFEDWFSRRDAPAPVDTSSATLPAEPLQHDHSYTSMIANNGSVDGSNSQPPDNELSQALAVLATSTCVSSGNSRGEPIQTTVGPRTDNLNQSEPRRSPRIAGQFRHRFLCPVVSVGPLGPLGEDHVHNESQNNNQNHGGGQSSASRNESHNDSQSVASSTSTLSTTAGLRGSTGGESPASETSSQQMPFEQRLVALRRFVNDLHNYGSPNSTLANSGSTNRSRRAADNVSSARTSGNRSRTGGRRSSQEVRFVFDDDSWEQENL